MVLPFTVSVLKYDSLFRGSLFFRVLEHQTQLKCSLRIFLCHVIQKRKYRSLFVESLISFLSVPSSVFIILVILVFFSSSHHLHDDDDDDLSLFFLCPLLLLQAVFFVAFTASPQFFLYPSLSSLSFCTIFIILVVILVIILISLWHLNPNKDDKDGSKERCFLSFHFCPLLFTRDLISYYFFIVFSFSSFSLIISHSSSGFFSVLCFLSLSHVTSICNPFLQQRDIDAVSYLLDHASCVTRMCPERTVKKRSLLHNHPSLTQ